MRKIFVTVAAIMLALVMSVTALGCNLIETDTEKDMNQVVATVQISSDVEPDDIKKQDIVMAYLNYGYQLEQQNGYTREAAINYILDSLIANRVYLQNAVIKFEKGEKPFDGQIVDSSKDKGDLERYLTEEELIEAEYNAKKDMDDLITNYVENEVGEKVGDTYTAEVRAIPTGATNAEDEELNIKDDKKEMEDFTIDTDSTPERKKAFNKVIELLRVNALLGDYEETVKITDTEYFTETLKGYKEQAIIDKYGKCITDDIHAGFDFAKVEALFNEKLDAQKKWTDSDYASALSSASATSPILSVPTGTYGFVYNLLLGASEDLTDELKEWKTENPNATDAEVAAERRNIFDKITVKDLRDTWILAGYDFDGEKFTGDYALLEDSLKFGGTVNHLNAEDKEEDDYKAEYNVKDVKEMSLDELVTLMETYIYGETKTDANLYAADKSVYKAVSSNVALADYEKRINELMFAFSTDPGSLNTYKGYLISPQPDGANPETYMQEFADYGRKVVNGEVGKNGYIMVATDYGYHVMFYSVKYEVGVQYANLKAYLDAECKDLLAAGQTWEQFFSEMQKDFDEFEETDNYLYALYSELVSTKITNAANKDYNAILNEYVYDSEDAVIKYESRYADLLEA